MKNNKEIPFYNLYCEICNWKKVSDGSDIKELTELQTSPIPGGPPTLDPVTEETIVPKSRKQSRKFRCPQCGRVIIPRKLRTEKLREEDRFNGREGGSERPQI